MATAEEKDLIRYRNGLQSGDIPQDRYEKLVHGVKRKIFTYEDYGVKEESTPKFFRANDMNQLGFVFYNEYGIRGNKHVDYLRKANWIERNIYRVSRFFSWVAFLFRGNGKDQDQ